MTEFPYWLKKSLIETEEYKSFNGEVSNLGLNTICRSALCPNLRECFSNKNITFLILGDICTRKCKFCNVKSGRPKPVDITEPCAISKAVKALDLKFVVITSVTRDDLADGGASIFTDAIERIRKKSDALIEILAPDFNGSKEGLELLADSPSDVFGHNIETVPRLYKEIRPYSDYKRSLSLLSRAKDKFNGNIIKTSFMVGLGETDQEIYELMKDIKDTGCDVLCIGQYLQPNKNCIPVQRFVHPEEFEDFKQKALNLGFRYVISGPFVRSSYDAEKVYKKIATPHLPSGR